MKLKGIDLSYFSIEVGFIILLVLVWEVVDLGFFFGVGGRVIIFRWFGSFFFFCCG